jgi:preprotein translocase subunit YajC
MLFDSIAHAMGSAGGAGAEGGKPITAFLPLILMFAIFYFLLIRPQQKKAKQHKEMLAGVRKGDKILTAGGIEGAVTDVDGDTLTVEIASGVSVKVNRNYVAGLTNPPRKADKEEK